MLRVYGIKNCSTCVKALKWLEAQGQQVEFIDYRAHPVDPALLQDWVKQLGEWPKLVNRASMTWRNLDDALKTPASDADWLAIIAAHPTVVRRPVTVKVDGSAIAGFNEKKMIEFLG